MNEPPEISEQFLPPAVCLLPTERRDAIITAARALIGVPFRHQGKDPETGLDCRGLLLTVGYQTGYNFAREYRSDYHRGGDAELLREALDTEFRKLRSLEHAQPADIVFTRLPRKDDQPRHVGIIVEGAYETMIIHSLARDGDGRITADPLRRWLKYIDSAYTWHADRFQVSGLRFQPTPDTQHPTP